MTKQQTNQQNWKQRIKEFLLNKWKPIDYIFYFLLIPLILVLVYLLPETLKQSFRLDIYSPNLISIFMSSYLHLTLDHFLGNLAVYLIIIFLIFNLETNKRFFYKISAIGFIFVPFFMFVLETLFFDLFNINNFPPISGFSGIVTFFTGYLVFVSYTYIKENYVRDLSQYFIYFLLMLNVFIWSLFNSWKLALSAFILLLLISLILEFNKIKKIIIKIFEDIVIIEDKKIKKFNIYKFLIVVLSMTFIISLIVIVPKDVVDGTKLINTAAHFFGYLLGIFIPWWFFVYWRNIRKFNLGEFISMTFIIILAAFGGNLIFKSDLTFRISGFILLMFSLLWEYLLLNEIDTRDDVKKTKEEIENLVDRAEESAYEIEEAKREIEETEQRIGELKKKIFGWHEPLFTIKSIYEDVNELKKQVGLNHGFFSSSSSLREKVNKLENDIKKIKRDLNIR